MRDVYRASPQTQLWSDPAMKPFKDKFVSKLSENLIQPLEKELGVELNDYTNLPQGQITFALTQNGWPAVDGARPGILFLLDTKDKSPQLMKNLADVRKKWVEAGKTLRTEKIRNIEFSVLPISDKDIPKTLRNFPGRTAQTDTDETATNAPKNEIFIGQFESLLIVGNAAKPIEKVLRSSDWRRNAVARQSRDLRGQPPRPVPRRPVLRLGEYQVVHGFVDPQAGEGRFDTPDRFRRSAPPKSLPPPASMPSRRWPSACKSPTKAPQCSFLRASRNPAGRDSSPCFRKRRTPALPHSSRRTR